MAEDYAKKIEERLRAAFNEVMVKAAGLIDEALNDHHKDLRAIFLRDRTLTVSLGLGVGLTEGGSVEAELTTGYTKERVKDKTRAHVTPGQEKLPGMGETAGGERPEDREAGEDVGRRGPCNVGSRQHSDSPFYCGDGMEYTDVENRLSRVKEMGPEQLRAVIALPGCQRTVVKAAEVRLRKLEKIAACDPSATAGGF